MSSLVRGAVWLAAPLVLILSSAPPAAAQMAPPEAPKNLQVLPKDMPRPEVVKVMFRFTTALGVRCDFCHVEAPATRPPGTPPFDFASDDKENKKKARVMMKMVGAINGDYLTKLGEGEEPPTVMCETCHRGQKEPPEPLAMKLTSTATSKGVDAAFDQDSLAALKKTKALFPQSADVAAALGMALAQSGDVAGGKAELERALSIDPNNGGAKFGLERLNHPPQPAPAPPK